MTVERLMAILQENLDQGVCNPESVVHIPDEDGYSVPVDEVTLAQRGVFLDSW